mgnify:FL=1
MKDNRSNVIKSILKENFKDASFRVRIKKYSGGESIWIYTDLIPEYTNEEVDAYTIYASGRAEYIDNTLKSTIEKTEKSKEIRQKINCLLKDFYHVDRDQFGEILSGGNTYLFICPLK